MWDNRAVLHRATDYDAVKHKRLMQRTTIGGDELTVPAIGDALHRRPSPKPAVKTSREPIHDGMPAGLPRSSP